MRHFLAFLFLLLFFTPSLAFAEVVTCGPTEPDLGAAAAKGPSSFLEITVPAGASQEETKRLAEEKLKQEIKFSNYTSLLTTSFAHTYQGGWEKLRPPVEESLTITPEVYRAQVFVTACLGGTSSWLPVTKQDITAVNTASLSEAAKATTPLKTYLTTLPENPAREQEILNGQQTALATLAAPDSPNLPGMSLHTRVKREGDPGEAKTYWDLCVTPSPTGCSLTNFITEVALGNDLRVITPSSTWGQTTNGACLSTEQLPGVPPFSGSGVVTARIFGQPSPDCEAVAAKVTTGSKATEVPCPGTYTPPSHIFQSEPTCISGSCIFNPLKIAANIATDLWQDWLNATAACQGSFDPVTCLRNLVVNKKVPLYTYYYLAGGNYGLSLGNTVKDGWDPGFNNLFRPPQTKYSEQQAQEEAKRETDITYLQHAVGPVKTAYTQIQCDFLTPPGQQAYCDKSEIQ